MLYFLACVEERGTRNEEEDDVWAHTTHEEEEDE